MRENTNVHYRLVKIRDPWGQNDGAETSSPLLEENGIPRAPFPSTMSGTSGLLKEKVCRDIRIQKPHRGVIRYS